WSSRYDVTASALPSPLNASLTPNELYGRAFGALMNVCSLHVVPFLTNTYAAPTQIFAPRPGGASLSHPGGSIPGVRHASSPEPTATVLPSSLIEVAKPNPSLVSPLDALMYACWPQLPLARGKAARAPLPP